MKVSILSSFLALATLGAGLAVEPRNRGASEMVARKLAERTPIIPLNFTAGGGPISNIIQTLQQNLGSLLGQFTNGQFNNITGWQNANGFFQGAIGGLQGLPFNPNASLPGVSSQVQQQLGSLFGTFNNLTEALTGGVVPPLPPLPPLPPIPALPGVPGLPGFPGIPRTIPGPTPGGPNPLAVISSTICQFLTTVSSTVTAPGFSAFITSFARGWDPLFGANWCPPVGA